MKFIVALLIASTQAIRYNIHGDLPWNPPAVEKAQNVYHDAPAHSNQPAMIEHVHSGRVESSTGTQIITSNPNSDVNASNNNFRVGPNNRTADTPKFKGVAVGTASVDELSFVNPAHEEEKAAADAKKEDGKEEKKGDAKEEKKEEKK